MADSSGNVRFETMSLANKQDQVLSSTGANYSSSKLHDSTIVTSCFPNTSPGDTILCPVTVMTPSLDNKIVRKSLLLENGENITSDVTGSSNSHLINSNTQLDGFNDSQATTCSYDDPCLGTSLATTAGSVLNNDVNLQEGINETVVQPPVSSIIPFSENQQINTSLGSSNEILIIDQTEHLHPDQGFQLTELEIAVNDDHTEPTEIVIQDTDEEILTGNPTISFMLNNKPIREILNTLENDHEEDGLKQRVPNNIQSHVNSDGIHSFMLTDSKTSRNTSILKQGLKTEFELETTSHGLNEFKTCLCTDLENRQEVPEDQMFVVQGQMYRLDTAVIVKIGHLQMHAFVRDDSLFVPKCLLFKLIDGHSERIFRHALRKKSIMQEMSTKEMLENDCELIRQKYNINTNCSSRLLIDLVSLRKISRLQTEIPSGISVLAHDDYMIKVKTANTRCSYCGSRIFNSTVKDEFDVIDLELLEANSKDNITNQLIPVSIGVLAIHKTKLPSFQMKSVTYICVKNLVHLNVLSLHYLQTKLTDLKYKPICAPPEVISNLKEVHGINYNSLWIDINVIVMIFESFEGKSKHFLQQKFIEKSLCFETRAEIFASDTSESEHKFVLSNETYLIVEKADREFARADSFFIGKKKMNKGKSSKISIHSSESNGEKTKGGSQLRKKRRGIVLEFGAEYIVKDIEELKAAVSEGVVHVNKNGVESVVHFSNLFDQASKIGTDTHEMEIKVSDEIKERPTVQQETFINGSIGNKCLGQSLDQSTEKTHTSNQEIAICLDQTIEESPQTGAACVKADTSSRAVVSPQYCDQTITETPTETAHLLNLTPRKRDYVCQNITQYLNWTPEKTDIDHKATLSWPNQIKEISTHQDVVSLNKTMEKNNTDIQVDSDLVSLTPVKKNRGKHDSENCIDQVLDAGELVHGETKLRSCKLSLCSKKGGTFSNSQIEKSRTAEMEQRYLSSQKNLFSQINSKNISPEKKDITEIQKDSQSQEKKIEANVTQDVVGKHKNSELSEVCVSVDGSRELFGSPVHAPKKSNDFQSPQVQAHDSIDDTIISLQLCDKNDDQLKSPTKLAFSIDKILSPVQTDEPNIEDVSTSELPLHHQVNCVTEPPLCIPDQGTMSSPCHTLSSKAKMNKIANKINSCIAPMMSPDSNTEPETNLNILAFAAIATAEEDLESEGGSFDGALDSSENQISSLRQKNSKERKKEFEMKIKQFVEFRVQNGIIEVTRFLKGAEAAFPELFRPHPSHPESLQRQKLFKEKVCQWVMGFVSKKSSSNPPKKKANTPRDYESSKSEKISNTDHTTKKDKLGQSVEGNGKSHGMNDCVENTQKCVSVNTISNKKQKSRSNSMMKIKQIDFESNQKRRKLDTHIITNNELKQRDKQRKKRKSDKLTDACKNKSKHGQENEEMKNVIADSDSCATNMSEASVNCREIHNENGKFDEDFPIKNDSVPEIMSTDKNKGKKVQSQTFQSEDINSSKQYRKGNVVGNKSHLKNCKSLISQKLFNKKENKKTYPIGSIKVCLKENLGGKKKKQTRQAQKVQLKMLSNETCVVQDENQQTENSVIMDTVTHKSLIDVDHTVVQNESLNYVSNEPMTEGRDHESDVNSNSPNSRKNVSKAKGECCEREELVNSLEESKGVTKNSLTDHVILKSPVSYVTQLDEEDVSPLEDNVIMPSRDNDILPLRDNGTLQRRDSGILPNKDNEILSLRVQRKVTRSDKKMINFEGSDKTNTKSVVDKTTGVSSLSSSIQFNKDIEAHLKWKALHEPGFVLLKRIPVIENSIAFRTRDRIS